MDTKSKRWKAAGSFLAFFLAVNLLAVAGVTSLGILLRGSLKDDWEILTAKSYQDTPMFRWAMANSLEEMLLMGTGGMGYSGYYFENEATESPAYASDGYQVYNTSPAAWERRQAAQQWHEQLKDDKNLLYTITYNGEVLYTNAEGMMGYGPASTLPEDYNFLLYFDGKKAYITQDGKEIDVYGDGYYREGSDWYLPGYRNFPVDEETAKTTVTLAAIQEPMNFVYGNYSEGFTRRGGNSLYWVKNEMDQVRESYRNLALGLVLGLLFACLYWRTRSHKAQADRAMARVSGRLWFELKGVLFLWAMGILLLGTVTTEVSSVINAVVTSDLSAEYTTEAISQYVPEIAYGMVRSVTQENILGLLLAFWICYLLVNDLRHNPKVWHNSLGWAIRENLTAKGMRLPIQQRMVRRYAWVLLACLPLLMAVLLALTATYEYGWTPAWALLLLLVTLGVAGGFLWSFGVQNRQTAADLGALTDKIETVREGELTEALALPDDADLRRAAEALDDIQQGLRTALDQQMRSERMKVELVANVSHDLKTPLTSIISYVELLSQEELPPQARDYVSILRQKAQRLKTMVQDVFSVSKAASGQLPVKMETLDLAKLLRQTLADMAEAIEHSRLHLRVELPAEPVTIRADGERLYRVFQNLLQNALNYSLEGSRIYVTLYTEGGTVSASVKNTSRTELPTDFDFTERFVRGDASRTDGGSGLGLSIARSFTEACGGQFQVVCDADLFTAIVTFPLHAGEADAAGEEPVPVEDGAGSSYSVDSIPSVNAPEGQCEAPQSGGMLEGSDDLLER